MRYHLVLGFEIDLTSLENENLHGLHASGRQLRLVRTLRNIGRREEDSR
jgi:hypothetical protein